MGSVQVATTQPSGMVIMSEPVQALAGGVLFAVIPVAIWTVLHLLGV